MPWWGWVLVTWPVVAGGVAVVLGRAIRVAERRDRGADRPGEEPPGDVPRNVVRLVEDRTDPPSDGSTGTGGQRTPR